MFRKNFRIAKNHKAILCAGQSHIQTARIVQETNTWGFIASDTRKKNEVFLSALETVNRSDLDFLIELGIKLPRSLHVTNDKASLSLVRGDDSYLLWPQTSPKECSN
jgi:hypothetical protein